MRNRGILIGMWHSQSDWPDIRAPQASRIDHVVQQLGRRRNDPFAWMRYVPDVGDRTLDELPGPLRDHLRAEMDYAAAMLRPLAAACRGFENRMWARVSERALPPVSPTRGWRYGHRFSADGAHRTFYRTAPDGAEEQLVDEAERARGQAYYRATEHQPSLDGRYFAWAEDLVGADRHRLCVHDTRTGRSRVLVGEDAYGYGGLTFSPSSRYLFWIWRDAHNRPTRLYRSALDCHECVLVYEEKDPAIFLQVARTAADSFVMLALAGAGTSEVRLIAAEAETEAPRVVRPRRRGVTYGIDEWAGALVMLTDEEAPDRRLLALDRGDFSVTGELVPHCEGTPIVALLPFAEALVRLERADGLHRLVLRHRDGREITIAFDEPAYALRLEHGQEYGSDRVRIVHETPASPPAWVDIVLGTGERIPVWQEALTGLDPADYRVERMEARAEDGESVPLTVLSRRDLPPGTEAPLLLTGYGAYGIASDPLFSLPATVLVDSGFRYAIAHVRGGSEKGRRWFDAGKRFRKRNSMTDFIACARHLIALGYTAKRRIVADGLSAGGLMVCGAVNIAPELWAGAIARVPFVDMLNTMSDADHPLVPLFRPDWGDPLADPEAYDYIASISPYENVRVADYPPVLLTAGLKDDRVPYWEPAKLAAAIRDRSTSSRPVILRLDPDSGHQASGDLAHEFAEAAVFWAFAERCVRV